MVGTFILVFFGAGSVHAAVLTGAQEGIWQVAIVWGAGISLAIYATGAPHMNPAMTVSFAVFRGFLWRQVPPYILETVATLQTICSPSEPRLDDISEKESSWRYGHGWTWKLCW